MASLTHTKEQKSHKGLRCYLAKIWFRSILQSDFVLNCFCFRINCLISCSKLGFYYGLTSFTLFISSICCCRSFPCSPSASFTPVFLRRFLARRSKWHPFFKVECKFSIKGLLRVCSIDRTLHGILMNGVNSRYHLFWRSFSALQIKIVRSM